MAFDTLTITGILAALLSGGFLVALVARNDAGRRRKGAGLGERATAGAESRP